MPDETAGSERAGGAYPLRGMRIVEVSGFVATPLGGMTLAQLGAEVIRVEPRGGGPDRGRWPLASSGTSLYWCGLNKGKRAVEVDFGSERGRELVARLVAGGGDGGGILISNTERYPELNFEALRARRADVIHVQLTGLRDGGTAVDYTVQAGSGFPLITGPENVGEPVNHVLPAWDVAAGLYLATGLLAAERHRLVTGEGQQVRIALEDVATATAGNLGYLAHAQLGGAERERDGNHVYGTFARDFATLDGERVMIVALTPRQWRDLVEVTGLTRAVDALAEALEADFESESDRYRHRHVLAELIAPWFARRGIAEVRRALGATRVLWSVYRSFEELAADDARLLRQNPLLASIDQPGVGSHLAPGAPIRMAGHQPEPVASPGVGEHTEQVLGRELGMTAEEIEQLRRSGVVGVPG